MSKYTSQESLVDGSQIRTHPSGEWDLCFSSGKHTSGTAKTQEAARKMALAVHKSWAYVQWAKGTIEAAGMFKVPIH